MVPGAGFEPAGLIISAVHGFSPGSVNKKFVYLNMLKRQQEIRTPKYANKKTSRLNMHSGSCTHPCRSAGARLNSGRITKLLVSTPGKRLPVQIYRTDTGPKYGQISTFKRPVVYLPVQKYGPNLAVKQA